MLIVLDSNILYGRANPEAANPLKGILQLVRQIGSSEIRVAIPEPCRLELLEGMRKEIGSAQEALVGAVSHLKRLQIESDAPSPDVEGALANYETRLREFLTRHEISTLPFPERTPDVRSLFEKAVSKRPPFDPTGNNYRDAMIVLTVEDRARREDAVRFVSSDGRVKYAFSAENVSRKLPEEMTKELENLLSVQLQRHRNAIREGISTWFGGHLAEVSERATADVDFEATSLIGTFETLLSIDRFNATKVESVDLEDETGDASEFVAKVKGDLFVTVEPSPFTTIPLKELLRRPTKVGELPQASLPQFSAMEMSHWQSQWPNGAARAGQVTLKVEGFAVILKGDRVQDVRVRRISQVSSLMLSF